MVSLRATAIALGVATGLSLGAAGCTASMDGSHAAAGAPATMKAVADLRTATNADAGTATVETVPGGLRVTIEAMGLPAGVHGAHIHAVGRCDAPDFASAAGHWNPGGRQHGSANPMGPHSGDLPNLLIGTDGRGSLAITLPGAQYQSLMDADGAALVVHAGPDDLKTEPSGNSGGRIACGVFHAG